jgi:micrococcal nuclease
VKTLFFALAVFGVVACGDSTGAPDTTPSESNPPVGIVATAAATVSPAPTQTLVTLLNAPLTVARSHNATLQAKTAPNTSCSIEVDYSSGPSTAAGLNPKTSNGAGAVSWTWKVGANTTRGAWPITVTCGGGSAETHITVT